MQHELDVRERLEASSEARFRLSHTLCHCAYPAAVVGIEMQNAIGLAEPKRAEHDGLGRG